MSNTTTNTISLLEWAQSGISRERATYLWDTYVVSRSGDWKTSVQAHVPSDLADEVAEAMAFFGAQVDVRVEKVSQPGVWMLGSRGYYHYIGA
jgi:hypothetical protein